MDLAGQVNCEVVHSPAPATGAVGVAVVGLGYAGCHHLERLNLRDDFRIAGAFDVAPAAVRKAAGLLPRSFRSWQELLTDDGVELVVVATPPATHAALAIEALTRGKHVLVETPLCLNVQDADALVEADCRTGRSLIVAGASVADHDFATALACLQSGALGRPRAIKHLAWQYSPERLKNGDWLPATCEIAQKLTGARVPVPVFQHADSPERGAAKFSASEAPPGAWRDRWETGGGALWEFGALRIGQLLQLTGELPESVYAALYRQPAEVMAAQDGRRISENAIASGRALARHGESNIRHEPEIGFLLILHFPSGLIAHLEACAGYTAPLQTGWAIAGTAGSYAQHTHYSTTIEGEVVDIPLREEQATGDVLYAGVVAHLRHGAPNPGSAVQARQVVEVMEAARASAAWGRPVAIGRITAP